LFNWPQQVVGVSERTRPVNLPHPLSRAELSADLQSIGALYGHILKNVQPNESAYYGADRSLYYRAARRKARIKPTAVVSMDLGQWPPALSFPAPYAVVAVDAERGRLAFIDASEQQDLDLEQDTIRLDRAPTYVVVSYSYGFSSEIGGGPTIASFGCHSLLGRSSRSMWPGSRRSDRAPLRSDAAAGARSLGRTGEAGIIRILDSGTYDEKLEISLPQGRPLWIVADTDVRPIIGKTAQPVVVGLEPGGDGNPGFT